MCPLFVYINPNVKEGEYKLVLVNNRDETYDRPSKPAHFWDTKILGGMDVEKGKEGGTWLGTHESGKIGCLLNVFQPKDSFRKDGAGRGFLVVNYLLGKECGPEYMNNISKSGVTYNPFNLVSLDPNHSSYDATFYDSERSMWQKLDPGFHGFGNCPIDKPFKKVAIGKDKFKEIIEMNGKTEKEEELVAKLNAMMQDKEAKFPDEQLSKQGQGHHINLVKGLSSLWVTCDFMRYGTRTTTTILVDHADRIVYRERTMKEPINLKNVEWEVNQFNFKRKIEG